MGALETYLITWMGILWDRLRLERSESGYSTQAVIITAAFAALALAVAAIITTKVLAKANSINLNGTGG